MVMRISEASQVLFRPSLAEERRFGQPQRAICHLSNVCLLMAWSLRPFANRVPNEVKLTMPATGCYRACCKAAAQRARF